MGGREWILAGAATCGLAVVLGAFGAHALEDSLDASGLENWRTAVRYQAWHGLAMLALAPTMAAIGGARLTLGLFLFGTALFSGSIYGLALGLPGAVLGPVTPLGGTLMIVAWGTVVAHAVRHRS